MEHALVVQRDDLVEAFRAWSAIPDEDLSDMRWGDAAYAEACADWVMEFIYRRQWGPR